MKALARDAAINVFRWLFPRACWGCEGDLRADEQGLCGCCINRVVRWRGLSCRICGVPLPDGGARCWVCRRRRRSFRFCRSAGLFEGVLRRAVLALKYGHRDDLAPALCVPLIRMFKERAELQKNQCVIPVPLHFLKRHARGFNQAELLGRSLAEGVGVPLVSGVLVRRRWTWAQARLGRDQRKTNVAGAFAVRNPDVIRGKRILLVDDVCTTGATLESCAEALKQAGARSVDALTLARDYTGPRPDFQ